MTIISRIRRIYNETGILGIVLRTPIRACMQISDCVQDISRWVLGRIPLRWLTPHAIEARLAKNTELKNKHAGERCFILGNGPSLARENIALLANETIFTCNQGYIFAEKHGFRPRYHAFVDPIFLEKDYNGFLDDIIALNRNWDTTLLTSTQIGDALRQRGLERPFYEMHQFLISDYAAPPKDRWPDLTTAQFGFLSVIHATLTAALYMGFKEIYLLGCDMTFFIDPNKTFVHSYGQGRFGKTNKTAADLFGWDQIDLMAWCLREFRGFDDLRQTAEAHGVKIVNAGQEGALNIYPRQALSDILGGAGEQ